MAVLSIAIFTRVGTGANKVLLSRQYLPISAGQIHGLLAAFPKLVNSPRQHTYFETEEVRYVYQAYDKLYLVLLTTKTSNLVEDLDTLRLVGRVLPLYCVLRNERGEVMSAQPALLPSIVLKNAFNLAFAFDEIVSMGYREQVSLSQIFTYLQGDSQEEKAQQMATLGKEREAKAHMRQKERQLKERARFQQKMAQRSPGMGQGMGQAGQLPSHLAVPERNYAGQVTSMEGGANYSPARSHVGGGSQSPLRPQSPPTPDSVGPGGGMSLRPAGPRGGAKAQQEQAFFDRLRVEDSHMAAVSLAVSASDAEAVSAVPETHESVMCAATERLSVILNKDGGMESLEVKGELAVTVLDESISDAWVSTAVANATDFQIRTHPNISKAAFFNSGVVRAKDPARPFPRKTPLPVLKWRYTSTDEANAPLLVNCWPAPLAGGSMEVNVEYELLRRDMELADVVIFIPLPGKADPVVGDSEGGELKYNRTDRMLEWNLPIICDSNATGTLDFTLDTPNQSAFFPVSTRFFSKNTYCRLDITAVSDGDAGESVSFGYASRLSTDQYVIT